MKTLIMVFVVVGAALMLTACGVGYAPSPWQEGNVMLVGDRDGVRALGDMINGIAKSSKESPDTPGAYFDARHYQENQDTRRKFANPWAGLFGGAASGAAEGVK